MATVSEFVSFFAEYVGTRHEEVSVRARHLREAGLLPSGGRGRGGAHVEAIHCANFLVGFLAAERAINAAEAVRQFANFAPRSVSGDLRLLRSTARNAFLRPEQTRQARPMFEADASFIDTLARLIEWSRYLTGFEMVTNNIVAIGCGRNWPSAFIRFGTAKGGFIQQDYAAPPIAGAAGGIQLNSWQWSHGGIVRTEARIMGEALGYLGEALECYSDEDATHLSQVSVSPMTMSHQSSSHERGGS